MSRVKALLDGLRARSWLATQERKLRNLENGAKDGSIPLDRAAQGTAAIATASALRSQRLALVALLLAVLSIVLPDGSILGLSPFRGEASVPSLFLQPASLEATPLWWRFDVETPDVSGPVTFARAEPGMSIGVAAGSWRPELLGVNLPPTAGPPVRPTVTTWLGAFDLLGPAEGSTWTTMWDGEAVALTRELTKTELWGRTLDTITVVGVVATTGSSFEYTYSPQIGNLVDFTLGRRDGYHEAFHLVEVGMDVLDTVEIAGREIVADLSVDSAGGSGAPAVRTMSIEPGKFHLARCTTVGSSAVVDVVTDTASLCRLAGADGRRVISVPEEARSIDARLHAVGFSNAAFTLMKAELVTSSAP